MRNPTLSSLSVRLSTRKSKPSGLQDEGLSSYAKVINFILAMYAIDDVIVRAVMCLEILKQAPAMAPTDRTDMLYTRAFQCDLVYKERRLKSIFVK